MSLAYLQSRVCTALEQDAERDLKPEERKASDLVASLGTLWCARNAPDPNEDQPPELRKFVRGNMKRIRKEQKAAAKHTNPDACQFFFLMAILGAIFSWLIEKGLDSLWEDYKQRRASYPAMAQEPDVCSVAAQASAVFADDDDSE